MNIVNGKNMIMDFKFFKQNNFTSYNGHFAQYALSLVHDYVSGRFTTGNRLTTINAEYVITETIYDNGQLSRCVVNIYPFDAHNTVLTFFINIGNAYPFITGHTIDVVN